MYAIQKDYAFSASHQLMGLPEEHQCARLHGHNYIIRLHLEANKVDQVGFVTDFGDLAPIKAWIDREFDHRHLNDVLPFNATSENFARYIYEHWCSDYKYLAAVSVSETPTSWATYRP